MSAQIMGEKVEYVSQKMMEATGQILPSFFFFLRRKVPLNIRLNAMEADAHT